MAHDSEHRNPFLDSGLASTTMHPLGLEVERAEGAWLQLTDGRRIMDAISGIGVSNFGHQEPTIHGRLRARGMVALIDVHALPCNSGCVSDGIDCANPLAFDPDATVGAIERCTGECATEGGRRRCDGRTYATTRPRDGRSWGDVGLASVGLHSDLVWLGLLGQWLPLLPTTIEAFRHWSPALRGPQLLLNFLVLGYVLTKLGGGGLHVSFGRVRRARIHTALTAAFSPDGLVPLLHAVVLALAALPALGGEVDRWHLTPTHSAYVRVAEGCDHACSFCAIPGFRGKFRSKPFDALLAEVEALVDGGAREINLIAEDTNQYGSDWGESDARRLPDLLRAIDALPRLQWIRLRYCYPSYFSEELVDDFLYLFELNSEGQIVFEEFVKVVKELKVLVHEDAK